MADVSPTVEGEAPSDTPSSDQSLNPLSGQSIEPQSGELRATASSPNLHTGTLDGDRFSITGPEASVERAKSEDLASSGIRYKIGEVAEADAKDQESASVTMSAQQDEAVSAAATQDAAVIREAEGEAKGAGGAGAVSANASIASGQSVSRHPNVADPGSSNARAPERNPTNKNPGTPSEPALYQIVQDAARTEDVAEKDALSREKIAKALAQLLIDRRDDKPLTIALFGPWGAGKSTLIALVRRELAASTKPFEYADFNAWKNERVDNMGAALAQSVVDALAGDLGFFSQLRIALRISARRKARLRRAVDKTAQEAFTRVQAALTWLKLFLLTYVIPFAWPISFLGVAMAVVAFAFTTDWHAKWLVTALGSLGTIVLAWVSAHTAIFKGLLESFKTVAKDQKLSEKLFLPDYTEKLGSAYEIGRTLEDLCALTLCDKKTEVNKQLLVVVDDLDRCSPGAIKQVFDAVRLVAHIRGVSVIVALDDRIAFAAVAKFFAEFGINDREPSQVARDYLAKVFNVSVRLEDAAPETVATYIRSHIFEQPEQPATQNASAAGSQNNPSQSPGEALQHEVAAFVAFANEFEFTNPRELWRLRQTWSLLKGMALPASAAEPVLNEWMRHMFLRERLMQGTNEQRRLAAEFLNNAAAVAPMSLETLVPNIGRAVGELRAGFNVRDTKILCVLLPAAPAEMPKAVASAKLPS
jgi:hypothetical protein